MEENKVIIFPTDTVYGIGAKLDDLEGIKRIYQIKGRDFNKPLAVLCSSIEQIEHFAILDEKSKLIAYRFWPGGLTLVLKTTKEYFNKTNEATIAVRIPNHKLALSILNENGPMKTTSVNQSGQEPLNDYNLIMKEYNKLVDKIYPNDETIQSVSSTVVDVTNGLNIIREGNISKEDIFNCL